MSNAPATGRVAFCALLLVLSAVAGAEGPGTITGRITDPSGLAVANVVVIAVPAKDAIAPAPARPAGGVTARSDLNGTYVLTLPQAGEYRIAFEFEGFERQVHTVAVESDRATLDVRLELAAIPQTVRVTQAAEDDSAARRDARRDRDHGGDRRPAAGRRRSPERAADLAPGVSGRGPNSALVMAGAFSYGNLFLVDGLPANENTRGLARPFFIQDAVLETRVWTGSVPAEYGRFQGGVVQTITRSGGNTVAGSIRIGITNDDWRALTPYRGDQTLNRRVPTWEAVIGGPAVRNRLYYFGAAMGSRLEQGRTLAHTRGNYTYATREVKYQLKGTWTPSKAHTFRASYFGVDSSRTNASTGAVMDADSLYDNESPESLAGVWYATVIGPRMLAEARYSRRWLTYRGSGSQDVTLEGGTPIWDRSRSDARFNSPQGCAICPGSDDERNNEDLGASLWLSLPPARTGTHEILAGIDVFRETRRTNAYQSGSGYRVRATRATIDGDLVYPVFLPDRTTWIYWQPILQDTVGNDLRTYSAFVSDTWRISGGLTIKAGLRFDLNDDRDSAGAQAVHDATWSPRLSAAWDPTGGGTWLVNGGWFRYVASVNSNVADAASAGGRPATYVYDYLGPAINASGAVMTPPHDALRRLFDWFLAPGAVRVPRSAPVVPGVNVRMDPGLAPLDAREIALGVSRRLGTRGSARIDGIYRRYLNFYATRRDMTTGTVTGPQGTAYDLALVTNADQLATRTYKGLLAQATLSPVGPHPALRVVHAVVDRRERGRRGRGRRPDDGADRGLSGGPGPGVERARRAAGHRPAAQAARVGNVDDSRASPGRELRPRPRPARRNRPRLERGGQHQPAGVCGQPGIRDAADLGAVLLQPARGLPDRHRLGHGPLVQLVARDPRHEEGPGVRAGRAGERLQPGGRDPGEQDRADAERQLGLPGLQPVHRRARAGRALRIRIGFRPADQPLRLPGAAGVLDLVRGPILTIVPPDSTSGALLLSKSLC